LSVDMVIMPHGLTTMESNFVILGQIPSCFQMRFNENFAGLFAVR